MSAAVRVGDRAPDFEVETVEGGLLRAADLRGLPTLLVFLRHLH